MVGGFIAKTLAADESFDVTVFDASDETMQALNKKYPRLAARVADLSSRAAIARAIADADLVVGALPGRLGFESLKAVIESGKNTVDISFFFEDAMELDALARARGVTAIVDCGVMPGFGGMTAVHFAKKLDRCDSVRILVGGLPESRTGVFEYKAPFSPSDVIEEYTRPARMRVGGEIIVKPALSEIELVEFHDIGALQAFNTDGLRTLLTTLPDVPNLVEKTLRYPGHAEKIAMLRDIGLLSDKPVTISTADGANIEVAPLELTSRLLIDQWKLRPGEREFTVMRVEASGIKDNSPATYTMDLLDRTDDATGDSSMARTTGLPAVAAARMLAAGARGADGAFDARGVVPAEQIGADEAHYEIISRGVRGSGVRIEFSS
jgi:saccharopine dehydrogenase-like NADP-dependent oxidoreductase